MSRSNQIRESIHDLLHHKPEFPSGKSSAMVGFTCNYCGYGDVDHYSKRDYDRDDFKCPQCNKPLMVTFDV